MSGTKHNLDDLRIHRSDHSRPAIGLWLALGILLLLIIAGASAWFIKQARPIEVKAIAARSLNGSSGPKDRVVLNASGYVTPRREATVSSKVTGKVMEVLIEEGMQVQEGQVLARLDDTNVKAGFALAEAQADSAKATLEETRVRIHEAELNLKRTSDLARNSISAQADLDRAEAEVKSLNARLRQQETQVTVAERELASWKQNLEDTIIRAPFSGIVTSKNAQPGEMISPISAGGGFTRTGICTIVDMASLEIEIDVNEGYINRVQLDQPVVAALDAYPDWQIPCRVLAIIPTADRQKSTVRVRVGFEKLDPRILPQMSIKVSFRETVAANGTPELAAKSVVLPKTAVQKENGRDVVMVVQNGRVEQRAVTLFTTGSGELAASAGLSPGEKVVVDWPKGLKDGSPVKVSSHD